MNIRKLLVITTTSLALVASVTGVALASTHSPKTAKTPAAVVLNTAANTSESTGSSTKVTNVGESNTTEVTNVGESNTTEADGPGGHQDPNGQNVDHQFNGQE